MRKLFIILAVVLFTVPAYADEYGKAHGLLGPVVFGPKLSIVGLPPSVGAELKVYGLLGAWCDYGMFPRLSYSNNDKKLSGEFHAWNAGLKVYPFGGRFFLGAGYGKYTLSLQGSGTNDGKYYDGELSVTATGWAARLGWLFSWPVGFYTSIDLGWLFPRNFNTTINVNNGLSAGDIAEARDKIKHYGKKGLPYLGLVQFGWLF